MANSEPVVSQAPPRRVALAFDGGGVRGLLAAACVAEFERGLVPGQTARWRDHVALVTGTSTGAILAAGIAAGRPAEELVSLYRELAPEVFGAGSRLGRSWRALRSWWRPRHGAATLRAHLERVFGDRSMNDLEIPIAICVSDAVTGRPRVMKSDHAPQNYLGASWLVRDVIAASAAAPTYFPSARLSHGSRDGAPPRGGTDCLVDGGLWANNPAMAAYVELQTRLRSDHPRLLSIGTGRPCDSIEHEAARRWGKLQWIRGARILDLAMRLQSQAVHEQLQLLWGDRDLPPAEQRYRRLDVLLPRPVRLDAADEAELDLLEELGRDLGRRSMNDVRVFLGLDASAGASGPR